LNNSHASSAATASAAKRRLADATLFLAFVLGLPGQQTAPAANAPAGGSPAGATIDPAIVELSPFEVSAETDHGYAARETLAGTRFKSELKDVPSQISVMTKEFLEDIASVTVEDAFRYSLNVENTTEFLSATNAGADFNTGVLNTRGANRIRAITNPGVTHDFFHTVVLQDTYNTERVSFSSGPNAILFGNGTRNLMFGQTWRSNSACRVMCFSKSITTASTSAIRSAISSAASPRR
jgi:outer membrane receptor for ferric coprogen and ferric-rhodotorulic acid